MADLLANGNMLLKRHCHLQGWLCRYCGVRMIQRSPKVRPNGRNAVATLDHIVPQARGGDDSFANTCAACSKCNAAEGSRSLDDFTASRQQNARRA